MLTRGEKVIDIDISHPKHCAEGALGHVADVTRYCELSASAFVTPNFVTARSRSIEEIPQAPEPARNVPVPESGQSSHYGTLTGTSRSPPVPC